MPEIQRKSEVCFWTEHQLHESEQIDAGHASDKQSLSVDQMTVTRIKEYRFGKYTRQVSFAFVLSDSCTNQNMLTP